MAKSVLVLGGTGTIGRATVTALVARGHRVTCLVRPGATGLAGVEVIHGHATAPDDLKAAMAPGRFDALVSCLASRTGAPEDAWAIDHQAHIDALAAAKAGGIGHMVLLSAICVQKPMLAFQHAKLAFEQALIGSGLTYSIARPTAFFKSLSGQIARVRAGKPFLVFGDGHLTACKPISDRDMGAYLADCLHDPDRHNRILPIGGPGPAITPMDQANMLFELLDQPRKIRRVPVGMMSAIIGALSLGGHLSPRLAAKAELARIGRYYATQSMLLWDSAAGRYDADATPETGTDTLRDHYADVIAGTGTVDLGDHAVF